MWTISATGFIFAKLLRLAVVWSRIIATVCGAIDRTKDAFQLVVSIKVFQAGQSKEVEEILRCSPANGFPYAAALRVKGGVKLGHWGGVKVGQ
jgi:hypothetical protein